MFVGGFLSVISVNSQEALVLIEWISLPDCTFLDDGNLVLFFSSSEVLTWCRFVVLDTFSRGREVGEIAPLVILPPFASFKFLLVLPAFLF